MKEKQQTVLVVDDEPTNVQALGNLLKNDYRIRVATSGEKALALLREQGEPLPDLMLLDVQMPGLDGYEVCRRIKQNEDSSRIAIIFVTALDSISDEEYGLNLGAVDYIKKPFSPVIVRARVNTHMQLKQKSDLLERFAMIDGLTGIPNRRFFDEQLEAEKRQSQREGDPLSIVMIDVDCFKPFNDHYGHGAGDQCLREISVALSDTVKRPADRVYRYGGEEFVALLPKTDASGAQIIAEKMRAQVAQLAIRHAFSDAAPVVTISLGVATLNPTRGGGSSLLELADKALYEAKRQGRNRVEVMQAHCAIIPT